MSRGGLMADRSILAHRLSRRQFGKWGLLAGGSLVAAVLVSACGGEDGVDPPPAATSSGGAPTVAPTSATTPASGATTPSTPSFASGATPPPSSSLPKGGTFTLARRTVDPASLDPHYIRETSEKEISYSIYEPLIMYVPGTTELEPRLASSWEVASDGLSYTFELWPNVKFQDGTDFNAETVQYSLDRLLGVGKGPSFVLSGVYAQTEIVDPMTAKVVLSKQSAPFLVSVPLMMMVSTSTKTHATDDDKWAEKWMAEPQNMNGTGPFKMSRLERGKEVVLERNPNYWAPDERPRVDKFVAIEVKEMSSQRLMLQKGDIDAMIPLPDDVTALRSDNTAKVELGDSIQMLYIQISQVVPPLDDVRVRQAIQLAFNYDAYVSGVYNNLADPAWGPIARLVPYYDESLPPLKRDLNRAKQLLAEAGKPDGGFELEFIQNQGSTVQLGAALLLQEGLQELGIGLKITELSWTVMVQRMQNPDNLMQLFGYFRNPDFPDPDAYFFGLWHTSNQIKGFNGTMYGSPETDQLIEQGRTEVDPKKRAEIYATLQRRLMADAAVIPLAIPKQLVALGERVVNFQFTPTIPGRFNTDTIAVKSS